MRVPQGLLRRALRTSSEARLASAAASRAGRAERTKGRAPPRSAVPPPPPQPPAWAACLQGMMMPPPGRSWSALAAMLLLVLAEAREARGNEGAAASLGQSRPYAVLKTQNLVLMGSVFGVLLIAVILMAVCVYKPIRRR
ncbi:uncharacterized protein C12orf76 homolog [Rhineura floridana]|uniref:uncharacterized protein C12orf76 homolog n=1 Tax=Rhineura floridana TaxID=261503 RepID=UPI002AC81024|nr:uncharacterized protein C12orf76 homolog [Rhineura floridana]